MCIWWRCCCLWNHGGDAAAAATAATAEPPGAPTGAINYTGMTVWRFILTNDITYRLPLVIPGLLHDTTFVYMQFIVQLFSKCLNMYDAPL